MNKEFIPYELALELKQLGFDEKCFCNWEESWSPKPEHEIRMVLTTDQTWLRPGWVRAPTFSQAFRWFREKYDIDIYIDIRFLKHDDGISLKKYKVLIPFPNELFIDVGLFTTHEEAELECLKKLIELVKPHEGGNK